MATKQKLFDRSVTEEQAQEAFHRLANRKGRRSIPARPDDDDLLLGDYLIDLEARYAEALRLGAALANWISVRPYDYCSPLVAFREFEAQEAKK